MSKLQLDQCINEAWVEFMFLVDSAIAYAMAGLVPDWKSANDAYDRYDALTRSKS